MPDLINKTLLKKFAKNNVCINIMSELNAVLCKIHNSKKKASHMTGSGFFETLEDMFYIHKKIYNPLGASQNINEVKTGVDGKHYFGK